MQKIEITKVKELDGIEIKNASFVNIQFPKHFHLDWSLAYVNSGSENIYFTESNFNIYTGAFILIPPYSIHANGNKNSWQYTAAYINSDVIKYICNKINVEYELLLCKPFFINYCANFSGLNSSNVMEVLSNLLMQNKMHCQKTLSKKCHLTEIVNHIEINSDSKITLATLEKKFKINKYKLLRLFNTEIGISPADYQNSIRIEKSKSLFYSKQSITNIGLEVGYFDQSHFTHNFKKYVGITPTNYKNNCNILHGLQAM